jgi:hypothetical protein
MALKATIKSLNDVDEAFRSLYVQQGDVYVLDLDDSDFKAKIGEFRDNNVALKQEIEKLQKQAGTTDEMREMLKRYEGIDDPDAAREALEKIKSIEEKKLIDAGQIDQVVEQRLNERTDRMKRDYESKIEALEKANGDWEAKYQGTHGRLSEVLIDTALQQAVTGVAPIKKGAMQDILSRGRRVWSLNDQGLPEARNAEGKIMYGKDGKEPITQEEWAQSLLYDAPYLFEGNAGGGAGGGGGGGNTGEKGIISASDQDAINANIDKIASGEVIVQ